MSNKRLFLVIIILVCGVVATVSAVRFRVAAAEAQDSLRIKDAEMETLRRQLDSEKARHVLSAEPVLVPGAATNDTLSAELAARIQELERTLEEKDKLITFLEKAPTNRPPRRTSQQGSRTSWMEDLKKNEPERYAEVVKAREEARAQMKHAVAKKAASLLNRDTKDMEEEERKEYELMVQLFDETLKLSEKMQDDLPRDEQRALRRKMGENMFTLTPLLEKERQREFFRLGTELGYTEKENEEFVGNLNEILTVTSMRDVFSGMRGGGGRRDRNSGRSTPTPTTQTAR